MKIWETYSFNWDELTKSIKVALKIYLFFLFYIVLGATNLSLAQNYFRTMPYTHSPLYAMKGAVESNNTGDSIALYHFKWEDDKLQSISYQLNGKLKPLYENYTCSDFIFASQNIFEYKKREIIVRHFNYLSESIKTKPAISRYLLDEAGRTVGLKYFDSENLPVEFRGIHEYRWKYFDNKVGEIRYSKNGEIVPMNNWFPYSWVLLSFDDHKNLKSIRTTDEDWEVSKNAVKIDFKIENNEIVKWVAKKVKTNEVTNNTGPNVYEVRHDFDTNGYLIRTRFYNERGDRIESSWGHMGFVRTYNHLGNRLSYNFIDENDEITIASNRGYSGQKFIWDTEGRFRLHTYYMGQKRIPIFRTSVGYAQIQFMYDFNGAEVGQVYKDAEGNIICTDNVQSYILLKDIHGVRIKRALCK